MKKYMELPADYAVLSDDEMTYTTGGSAVGGVVTIVVKAEYYWGTRCWWIFLVLGIAGIIGTVLISDILISSLLGVFSFSSFWTIKEIFEQRERVLKGWFPMNPKRKHEYE